MSGYRKNAASNRDALFGSLKDDKPKSSKKKTTPAAVASGTSASGAAMTSSPSKAPKKRLPPPKITSTISADAKAAKVKEAEEYKQKANKCMESGIFKRPDPVAASTFYKRAADCYRVLQDTRMERLYRVESAECNRLCGAWPSAANDFIRAAELSDTPQEASDLYQKAAAAWTEGGESAKAAKAQVDAAMVFQEDGTTNQHLNDATIIQLERAVEAHVPDPLNPYARYRQTGNSLYLDPDSEETVEKVSAETLALAEQHMVQDPYAHEPLTSIVIVFAGACQYASALYAAGAVSKILKSGGMSTLSLARAYFQETILTLAMGDPIFANERFMNPHLQDNFYLKSRECAAAEDLIRAIQNRDEEALEEARTTRQNRTAIANLPPALQAVVSGLRTSGVARVAAAGSSKTSVAPSESKEPSSTSAPSQAATSSLNDILNAKTGYEGAEGEEMDAVALDAELDALDFGDDGEEDMDDDDVDLR